MHSSTLICSIQNMQTIPQSFLIHKHVYYQTEYIRTQHRIHYGEWLLWQWYCTFIVFCVSDSVYYCFQNYLKLWPLTPRACWGDDDADADADGEMMTPVCPPVTYTEGIPDGTNTQDTFSIRTGGSTTFVAEDVKNVPGSRRRKISKRRRAPSSSWLLVRIVFSLYSSATLKLLFYINYISN